MLPDELEELGEEDPPPPPQAATESKKKTAITSRGIEKFMDEHSLMAFPAFSRPGLYLLFLVDACGAYLVVLRYFCVNSFKRSEYFTDIASALSSSLTLSRGRMERYYQCCEVSVKELVC